METRAYLKGTRLSAQKAGLVADVVRGKSVHAAMDFLTFHKQKASAVIKKLLESAIANAENNDKADIDLLVVKSVIVNQGMRLKRMKPRARGRADRIIKPTCHIEIILSDQEVALLTKQPSVSSDLFIAALFEIEAEVVAAITPSVLDVKRTDLVTPEGRSALSNKIRAAVNEFLEKEKDMRPAITEVFIINFNIV